MKLNRIICLLLCLCLLVPPACAEEEEDSFWGSIGNWFTGAWEDTSDWVSEAWDDSSSWVVGAWDDSSEWVAGAWNDASDWVVGAWDDTTDWVVGAWDDTTEWIVGAWDDVSAWLTDVWSVSSEWVSETWGVAVNWTASQWRTFTSWVITVFHDNPYGWFEKSVENNGLLAYDRYISMRSFLSEKPDAKQLQEYYYNCLDDLSFLYEERDTLWSMLEKWSAEHNLDIVQTASMALPFLEKLMVEGSAAIGDDIIFSGPIVSQYLLTLLEDLNPDSPEKVRSILGEMSDGLDEIVRPVVAGDDRQNVLVTDDGRYIEYFSYGEDSYKIIMVVSALQASSVYPLIDNLTIQEMTCKYFNVVDCLEERNLEIAGKTASAIRFSSFLSDSPISGEAFAVWGDEHEYFFLMVTEGEFRETDAEAWISSLTFNNDGVSFDVDPESDGAFYGINQSAQRYTINRIFDEEHFTQPYGGRGWAAERGNNLIDNLKGIFQGNHAIITGDNNALNGPDRMIQYSNGSTLFIQSKYYHDASKSIAACFENGQYRYFDAAGNPMSVEVASDQYKAAIDYMQKRIRNGQVKGIDPSDVDKAKEIVRKGNLTYKQAQHIAKAGTIESISYDVVHGCVSAGTSMGLSAAVQFAVDLWNGDDIETALKDSIYVGLYTGGTTFIISVLSAQLSKTGLNTALIPASQVIVKAMGPKAAAVIVNAFRPAGSAIYGAAAMNAAAKLLRGNMITGAVTFVVLSAGDVYDIISGRISWTQLAKNASVRAVGIAGGYGGYLGGAAIGTAIFPGPGTVIGGIIGSLAVGFGADRGADAIADLIADDDAEKMIRIIEQQFSEIATEYFLSETELQEAITILESELSAKVLKKMYQYDDHEAFARQMIELAMDTVVAKRTHIELPDEGEYADYMVNVLQNISDELEASAEPAE